MSENQTFSKVYYEEPSAVQDTLNLARSLFDLKEYRKCANLLAPLTTPDSLAAATDAAGDVSQLQRIGTVRQSCLFIKNQAMFLVSEQAKEEEILETGGTTDKIICSPVINQQLCKIEAELEPLYE